MSLVRCFGLRCCLRHSRRVIKKWIRRAGVWRLLLVDFSAVLAWLKPCAGTEGEDQQKLLHGAHSSTTFRR